MKMKIVFCFYKGERKLVFINTEEKKEIKRPYRTIYCRKNKKKSGKKCLVSHFNFRYGV